MNFEINTAYRDYLEELIATDVTSGLWPRKSLYPYSVPGNIATGNAAFAAGYRAAKALIR